MVVPNLQPFQLQADVTIPVRAPDQAQLAVNGAIAF